MIKDGIKVETFQLNFKYRAFHILKEFEISSI